MKARQWPCILGAELEVELTPHTWVRGTVQEVRIDSYGPDSRRKDFVRLRLIRRDVPRDSPYREVIHCPTKANTRRPVDDGRLRADVIAERLAETLEVARVDGLSPLGMAERLVTAADRLETIVPRWDDVDATAFGS